VNKADGSGTTFIDGSLGLNFKKIKSIQQAGRGSTLAPDGELTVLAVLRP
jgi:hypothetical protein